MKEECVICIEELIDNSGFLLLECCNNKVHINCLNEWIITNFKKGKIFT